MPRVSSGNILGLETRETDGLTAAEKKRATLPSFLSRGFRLAELDKPVKAYEESLHPNHEPLKPGVGAASPPTVAGLQERAEVADQEQLAATSHSWPIFLVILPPVVSIFFGDAQTWSDLLLLVLVGFYLFLVIKVPWELYFVAKKKRVNLVSQAGVYTEPGNAAQEALRFEAERKLKRQERASFFVVILSPMLGGYLLHQFKNYLSQYDQYFSQLNIVIFVFAAGIKPIMYLADLLKTRALMLQEEIHYPVGEVEGLKRRVGLLENELTQLRNAYVTKLEINQVRDGIEPALIQLTRILQRYENREQRIRARQQERLAELEKRLGEIETGEGSAHGNHPPEKAHTWLLFFVACFSRFVFLPLSFANGSLRLVQFLLPTSLLPGYGTKRTSLIQNSNPD
ncbi:hypothetical protein K493DRAFT_259983 [Basidiobolus meristosporus CBS 931.73]|uniref:Uncharacterized protein n=1 Tax=Basidiobolus meristosporus CBS 931.73 TaxID=1314790 RepID=A0A1Y1YEC5_9FUNG|nr:hypothetical protein K493DRAFT_259983 [Basidiobolus meristosporus CBS 931.73]|eukprot:ORX96046.1 hypothetical protein K493DRAFT_259983 [Basidiobolus meristosporus CBS 931.73]